MNDAAPLVLTLVAQRDATVLDTARIARVRAAVAGGMPDLLSPGEAADIPLARAPEPAALAAALDDAAIDAFVLPAAGRRKQVLIADMDSTIVTGETLDELAAFAGLGEQIAAITKRSMNGELDFSEALRARVAMLKGLDLAALERTWEGVRFMPGARELVATMRAHGATTALVSGGFTFFTGRVAQALGFSVHRANILLDDGRALTGAVAEPILDRDAKLAALRELAAARGIGLEATLAVGDGANDLAMLGAAGLGIAYHAKPIVASSARWRVEHGDLRALLFVQGYRAAEFAVP
ncbi:MAG: phosphoserine phosphatase SerB [Rhodospirillales bacterium]|nr:phosphoserine phosphatase SerB [Rhodospirillales bacterium]